MVEKIPEDSPYSSSKKMQLRCAFKNPFIKFRVTLEKLYTVH